MLCSIYLKKVASIKCVNSCHMNSIQQVLTLGIAAIREMQPDNSLSVDGSGIFLSPIGNIFSVLQHSAFMRSKCEIPRDKSSLAQV